MGNQSAECGKWEILTRLGVRLFDFVKHVRLQNARLAVRVEYVKTSWEAEPKLVFFGVVRRFPEDSPEQTSVGKRA